MKSLHALAVIKDARDTGRLRAVYDVLDEIDACDFEVRGGSKMTAAARMALVMEWAQMGIIDHREARRLMRNKSASQILDRLIDTGAEIERVMADGEQLTLYVKM